MVRSILSVLAGFATWSVLWLASNATLTAILPGSFREDGSTDSSGLLLLILALSVLSSLVAGYLTATIARRRPLLHATVLGAIQLAIGIAVQIGYWDVLPVWYHLLFLALLLPGHAIGGWLRAQRG